MRFYEIASNDLNDRARVTKPEAPLTPAQTVRRSERQKKIQQDIRDTQNQAAKRLSKLRAKAQDT